MFKRFVKIWVSIVVICVIMLFVCSVIIDPIGILDMPKIRGINNYKVEQNLYVYVYKPYQYLKANADVVFVGSSRVHAGLKANLLDKQKKVYNFGCSGMTLPHMEEILKFIYNTNKPKEIYIGLDFFQFAQGHFRSVKSGFSIERLENLLNKSSSDIFVQSMKENFMLSKSLWATVKMSRKNKDAGEININGWNSKEGSVNNCNKKAFYGAINQYKKAYDKWIFEPESIKCLKRIVNEAQRQGVKLVFFMNPINIDLFALINAHGLYSDFEMIKKLIVSVVGKLYDFNFVNDYTKNRDEFYFDAAHYNAKFGEAIKKAIALNEDKSMLHILTEENKEEKLNKQHKYNELWMIENAVYLSYLRKRVKCVGMIEQGELQEFIGF